MTLRLKSIKQPGIRMLEPFIYYISENVSILKGNLDLSSYMRSTIIVPSSIQVVGSYCITCMADSGCRNNTHNSCQLSDTSVPHTRIILTHTDITNLRLDELCFDGISELMVMNSDIQSKLSPLSSSISSSPSFTITVIDPHQNIHSSPDKLSEHANRILCEMDVDIATIKHKLEHLKSTLSTNPMLLKYQLKYIVQLRETLQTCVEDFA